MSLKLGTTDYYEGALCRLEDARRLEDQQRWVAAVYLAGRAVEAMLRSLLWVKDRQQEIGHDLRDLLKRSRSLGMLDREDEEFDDHLEDVARLWHNNLRYAGDGYFLRCLKQIKMDRGLPRNADPVKVNAQKIIESCEIIISRGELVWNHSRRR